MENADDLDQSGLDSPIVKHVHWVPYFRAWSIAARMPQMKAAKSGQEFLSGLRERRRAVAAPLVDVLVRAPFPPLLKLRVSPLVIAK